jgi:Icc-related predicted phosphoesterase
MTAGTGPKQLTFVIIADDDSIVRTVPDQQADILISCGDLSDETILAVAQKCHCSEILAVKGNRDSSAPFRPPIRDLHLKTFDYQRLRFGGFCGSWKYKPKGNYLFEQNEVEAQLENFPHVDFFIAHNSPRGIHDCDDDVHLGFTAFNKYIKRTAPVYFIHGHQHQNIETIVDGVKVIGVYGHRFLTLNFG